MYYSPIQFSTNFSHLCRNRFLSQVRLTEEKNKLRERKTIQSFFAGFLLILFAFSNTPKIYFHDVIANHKDVSPSCIHPQQVKACIHEQGYHCEVEDLVVTAPYLILPAAGALLISYNYQQFSVGYFSCSTQDCFIHKESRGPPTV